MPLKEYKPGTAFSGVIGRTFDQSEPAWPEPKRAKEGAPNVLFIVLDDTGFGHSAAMAARSKRRSWMRWPRTACATTIFTPPQYARRPVPAS